MFILTFSLLMISLPAFAQVRQVDVLVTVVKDRVVALPGGGSPVEEPLGVNETIVTTAAQAPAGCPNHPPTVGLFFRLTAMDGGAVGHQRACRTASRLAAPAYGSNQPASPWVSRESRPLVQRRVGAE